MLVKWETSAWIGLMIQNRMYGDDVLFKSFVSAKIYDFMKLICLQVYDFSNWHMPLTLGSKRGFFTYCLSPLTYCLNDYLNNFFFNFEKALWNIITNLYNIILIVLQYLLLNVKITLNQKICFESESIDKKAKHKKIHFNL